MKSDRKMTEDILVRVNDIREKKHRQKNTAAKAMGSLFAFTLVIAAAFSFFGKAEIPSDSGVDMTVETTGAKASSYAVVIAGATEKVKIYKESSVSIPFGGLLSVTRTKNASRDEMNRISYDVQCALKEMYGEDCDWSVRGIEGKTSVYFGTADRIKLEADSEGVEEIILTCGENGKLMIFDKALLGNTKEFRKTIKAGKKITVSGEEYKNISSLNEGMEIQWSPSEELHEKLSAAPETPLTEISDEITGIIRYIDGAEESFTIKLAFDDSGVLDATYSHNY